MGQRVHPAWLPVAWLHQVKMFPAGALGMGRADLPNHASSLTPTLKHSFTHSQCDSLTQLLTLNPVPTDHFHSHSVSHPQFLCPQITILRQEVVSKEMPPPEVVAPSNPSKPLAPTAAAAATLLARQRRYVLYVYIHVHCSCSSKAKECVSSCLSMYGWKES